MSVKTATKIHWSRKLIRLGACEEAVEYSKAQPSFAVAWKKCERGDWMLWLAGRCSGSPKSASRKRLVLAACACARLALKHVRKGDERPRIAIETAEKWARGKDAITLNNVRVAVSDVNYAIRSACAVAWAACAAEWSACAAVWTACAAENYAESYAARAATLKTCADLVRKHYPQPPRMEKSK